MACVDGPDDALSVVGRAGLEAVDSRVLADVPERVRISSA